MLTNLQLQGLKNKCYLLINSAKDIDDFNQVGEDIKKLTSEYKEKHIKKENNKKIVDYFNNFNKKHKTNFIELNKLNIDGFYSICKGDDHVTPITLMSKYDTLYRANGNSVSIFYDNVSGCIFVIDVIYIDIKYHDFINNDKEKYNNIKEVSKIYSQIEKL